MSTAIEWTDETWNPVTGCTRVSEGCRHCYIERTPPFRMNGRKLGDPVQLHPERLAQPLRWMKPRRVFVNSLSDLFHEDVPDEFIDRVFAVMALAKQHTFQILTKRPGRMQRYMAHLQERCVEVSLAIVRTGYEESPNYTGCEVGYIEEAIQKDPLPNVWLGVSIEDQKTADERIPILLQTPAPVRFVSAEPLLGPVDLKEEWLLPKFASDDSRYHRPGGRGLDWVVTGGESGPSARPCDIAWVRSIVEQCRAAAVPCFVKQLGSRPNYSDHDVSLEDDGWPDHVKWDTRRACIKLSDKKGGDPAEWPADLRVREMPK